MAKLIHAMIRVLNEQKSTRFYADAFDLVPVDRFEFDSFILVYLRNAEADFELELTINRARVEPYDLGDGYGHLAVAVDDLDATHERLTALGLAPTPIRELEREGVLLARFAFIQDPDGYRIEILQRHGRYR
jgi:lactoylglutathione lyase